MKLPSRCFVSHSYKDEEAIQSLTALLRSDARHVKLDIFKWRKPDVRHAVSNRIVPRILRCDGLIFLDGGASSESHWVDFERDYGLRAGKPVFAFDTEMEELSRYDDDPLDLSVQVVVSEKSIKRARKLLRWMRRSRHFDLEENGPVYGMKEFYQFFEDLAGTEKLVLWLIDDITNSYAAQWEAIEHRAVQPDGSVARILPRSLYVRIGYRWRLSADERALARTMGYRQVKLNEVDLIKDSPADGLNWNEADTLLVEITNRLAEPPRVIHEV